jgi:hypothetical protein
MKTKMRTKLSTAIGVLVFGVWGLGFGSGCAGPKTLEPGGVYAPTNDAGELITNERGLALTDASYRFAYDTALSVFRFEREHRAEIFDLSPVIGQKIKTALDGARATVWEVDQRWARARLAYRLNPTPAGLTTLQTVLSELERIIPVIQSQMVTLTQALHPVTLEN